MLGHIKMCIREVVKQAVGSKILEYAGEMIWSGSITLGVISLEALTLEEVIEIAEKR